LIDMGLSHRSSVLALYGVGAASAIVAFVLTFVKSREIGFLLLGVLAGSMAALVAVLYLRLRRMDRGATEARADTPEVEGTWAPSERRAPSR